MKISLHLLAVLAFFGAFDTLYYHEWRAKLPALGPRARSELRLHAFRDFVYAVLLAGLPWVAWEGWYLVLLVALLFAEVVLTLWDFVIEDWIRKPLGGVYAGERAMHGIMDSLWSDVSKHGAYSPNMVGKTDRICVFSSTNQ